MSHTSQMWIKPRPLTDKVDFCVALEMGWTDIHYADEEEIAHQLYGLPTQKWERERGRACDAGHPVKVPYYTRSIDEMVYAVENRLSTDQTADYGAIIAKMVRPTADGLPRLGCVANATAMCRATAFLAVLSVSSKVSEWPFEVRDMIAGAATPNVTRNGIEVKIGQVWRNLDKRMRGQTIEIRAVADGYAFAGPSLKTRIRISRMYKHSSGFELVSQP